MSVNADDIRVRIAGDLADIRKSINDLKKETRQAGATARSTRGDWQKLGKGLDRVRREVKGLVGAYVGFRAISATIRTVVANTIEQERVTAQLEARLKSTGGVAGFTADELLSMADGLQAVTAFGDEAIVNVQQLLLTFTQIRGDVLPAATEAILDMSTALGSDLKSAAIQVGKALNDPVVGASALREVGVSLTKQQIELVKRLVETGDVASAQRLILEELSVEFGGSARAARDTFGGALESLKNAVSDLTEGSGGNLEDAKDAINELTELLRDPATVEAFGVITDAIVTLTGVTVKAVTAFTNFGQGIGETVAQAFGAGTPIDSAAERIEEIQQQIDLANLAPENLGNQKFILKLRAEQAELQKLVDLNNELTEGRRQSAGGTASEPDDDGSPIAVTLDGRPAIRELQTQLAAASVLLKGELKRLRAQLDQDFADNLVKLSEFYQRRTQLETQAVTQQIESQRAALSLLDEEIRLIEARGESTEVNERKRAELVASITELEQQRGDIAAKAARDQAKAERDLASQLATVRSRLQELQGDTVGARSAELEREFASLLERLAIEGDEAGEQLVRRLIDIELAKAQLAQLEDEYSRSLSSVAREEQRVQALVDTGTISEREGRRRIIELHQATATEVSSLIPLMRDLAEATGDPDAIERVKDLEVELDRLANAADRPAIEMRDNLQDAGESAFSSFLSGAQEAGDAWRSLVADIRQRAADLVAENLLDGLFSAFGGGGGTGGAIATFLAGLFHQGGIAGQAGPSRRVPAIAFAAAPRLHRGGILGPNEVPAILNRGEEVLTRQDPRHRANRGRDGVTVNIAARDAESFRRQDPGQVGAQIGTAIFRARRRNA